MINHAERLALLEARVAMLEEVASGACQGSLDQARPADAAAGEEAATVSAEVEAPDISEVEPHPVPVGPLLQLDDLAFVEAAYLAILQRKADPDGLTHYLFRLAQGAPRMSILTALASSDAGRRLGVCLVD